MMTHRLNAICPYYTMFPLEFPMSVLRQVSTPVTGVLDPFCGRGTSLLAARLNGVPAYGVDMNPLATAVSRAKMVDVTPAEVVDELNRLLGGIENVTEEDLPVGEFWELAFHKDVLRQLVHLREKLRSEPPNDWRTAIRAIVAGGLHGPLNKNRRTYLSNQAPRTFSPKPGYAVRFWKQRNLAPPRVDLREIVKLRAAWYFGEQMPSVPHSVVGADSRNYSPTINASKPNVVITSPPYWGMRSYHTDQWLRIWFLGGADVPDYDQNRTFEHSSSHEFAANLRSVWNNLEESVAGETTMIVRFGSLPSKPIDLNAILDESVADTSWEIFRVTSAGSPSKGRRQAEHYARRPGAATEEKDFWLRLV